MVRFIESNDTNDKDTLTQKLKSHLSTLKQGYKNIKNSPDDD